MLPIVGKKIEVTQTSRPVNIKVVAASNTEREETDITTVLLIKAQISVALDMKRVSTQCIFM